MKTLLCALFAGTLLLSSCGTDETATRPNNFTPLTAITIVAPTATPAPLTSTRLTATGNFSGLFSRDISADVTWSSSAPAVADFTLAAQPGRLFALTSGSTNVTATLRGVTATLPVTVSSATIAALAITPAAPNVAKGLTQQFSVTGTFSDATTQDLTFDAAWTSSDPAVATIGNDAADKGLGAAVTVGTSTIGAAFAGVSASTVLTVVAPILQEITVTPANAMRLSVQRGAFRATGHYSDGSTSDITTQTAWSSSLTTVATIDGTGAATTHAPGSTTVRATLAGISGSTNLWVGGGTLTAIALTPSAPKLAKGSNTRLAATGSFSNGTTREITGVVDWSVGNDSFATIAPPNGQLAWLTTLAATPALAPTTIKAQFGTIATTTPLEVTAATLVPGGLTLLPTSRNLTVGGSARFTLTGNFDDGSSQELTASADWSSSDGTIVEARNSGLDKGRVVGLQTTTSPLTVTAAFGGQSVAATATVTSRGLQSLTLSALPATFVAGTQAQFTATATYDDGATADVTSDAIWSCANDDVASMVDGINRPGVVVAVASGTTTLTASFGGQSRQLTLTVP